MAKTDSFGRPYYETAEEYNQAHRKARANGNYEQMQQAKTAYSHTTGRGAKKQYGQNKQKSWKSSSAIIALCILIAAVSYIVVLSIHIEDSIEPDNESWYEEEYIESDDANFEQIGVDNVPLEEGFDVVTYKGVSYDIPMLYEDFILLDVPLSVYPSSSEELYAGDWNNLDMEDDEGNIIGYIRIANDTDEDMPLGKCSIDYILFSSEAAFSGDMNDAPEVTFANGLDMTCGYEDLEAYMGIPTYKYTDEDSEGNLYESYQWEYSGEASFDCFTATFWNGIITDISITVDEY